MDLTQKKLSKAEWLSIEVSVSDQEKKVLELIMDGYAKPDIRTNSTNSLFTHMKIEPNDELEYYLYKEYFEEIIRGILAGVSNNESIRQWLNTVRTVKTKSPNKADMIRIQNVKNTTPANRENIFEFVRWISRGAKYKYKY